MKSKPKFPKCSEYGLVAFWDMENDATVVTADYAELALSKAEKQGAEKLAKRFIEKLQKMEFVTTDKTPTYSFLNGIKIRTWLKKAGGR